MAEVDDIRGTAAELVHELAGRGKTVTTAESCTGGWIAKAITDIAGSSAVFACGVVSYSNAVKAGLLGVDDQTLAAHGAVSERTVAEMAEGAIRLADADFSVAVSGIAGPDGGTRDKPVGTVWFAWARRDGTDTRTATERRRFSGDRNAVRRQSVLHALRGIRDTLRR